MQTFISFPKGGWPDTLGNCRGISQTGALGGTTAHLFPPVSAPL